MNYVSAVVIQFTSKEANEVIIKARGKFITRAVDVAEVATKKFLENVTFIKEIISNSEEFENDEGRKVRVSTLDIVLARQHDEK